MFLSFFMILSSLLSTCLSLVLVLVRHAGLTSYAAQKVFRSEMFAAQQASWARGAARYTNTVRLFPHCPLPSPTLTASVRIILQVIRQVRIFFLPTFFPLCFCDGISNGSFCFAYRPVLVIQDCRGKGQRAILRSRHIGQFTLNELEGIVGICVFEQDIMSFSSSSLLWFYWLPYTVLYMSGIIG